MKITVNWEEGPEVCHYMLTDGKINYCPDSTHSMKGQSVPLPELPEHLRD